MAQHTFAIRLAHQMVSRWCSVATLKLTNLRLQQRVTMTSALHFTSQQKLVS
jgi:hypothetical protein